jgi:hypothetical protein
VCTTWTAYAARSPDVSARSLFGYEGHPLPTLRAAVLHCDRYLSIAQFSHEANQFPAASLTMAGCLTTGREENTARRPNRWGRIHLWFYYGARGTICQGLPPFSPPLYAPRMETSTLA